MTPRKGAAVSAFMDRYRREKIRRDLRFLWHAVSGRRSRLPDFLCVGAQRSGTTTLHRHLQRHPDVFAPPSKEVQYFTLHYDRPASWYRSCFAEAGPHQAIGDFTPYYLFHPFAASRIAATVPDVRIVVLLRDPVQRALSGYFHARRKGLEPLELEEAFRAEAARLRGAERELGRPAGRHHAHASHGYAARSRYEEQLPRYLDRFPRSRILLLRSEDLFGDPEPTLTRVQEFLGLSVRPLGTATAIWAGKGEHPDVPRSVRDDLRERLAPTYEEVRRSHGIGWDT